MVLIRNYDINADDMFVLLWFNFTQVRLSYYSPSIVRRNFGTKVLLVTWFWHLDIVVYGE